MFNLDSILRSVQNGKLSVKKAKSIIEAEMGKMSDAPKNFRSLVVDQVIKRSSDIVGQLSSHLPVLEKIGESLVQKASKIADSNQITGFETKLTVVTNAKLDEDSISRGNVSSCTQITDLSILEKSGMELNKFIGTSLVNISFHKSKFISNEMSISKLNSLTMQSSDIERNKFSRCTWTESTFSETQVHDSTFHKCTFLDTLFYRSTLDFVCFKNTEINAGDFEDCTIKNIHFIDCIFDQCVIRDCSIESQKVVEIQNKKFKGITLSGIKSVEELLLQASETA